MAQNVELTWGKCTVDYSIGSTAYSELPKLDSTKLTSADGNAVEAKVEGGGVLDVRRDSDSYTLVWDTYIHPANADKYKDRIATPDRAITKLSVTPANKAALCIIAANANLHSTFSFDTQGGILMHNQATLVLGDGGTQLFELKVATASSGSSTGR